MRLPLTHCFLMKGRWRILLRRLANCDIVRSTCGRSRCEYTEIGDRPTPADGAKIAVSTNYCRPNGCLDYIAQPCDCTECNRAILNYIAQSCDSVTLDGAFKTLVYTSPFHAIVPKARHNTLHTAKLLKKYQHEGSICQQ